MQSIWQDLRYCVRSIRKSPGFAALAILALALGIGANTAIFSVVNGVLLKPLAYADPGRLVVMMHGPVDSVSPADYLDWRNQTRSYEQMGAAQGWSATLTGQGEAEAIPSMQVSSNLFNTLGVPAMLGRTFRPGEDTGSAPATVVLSYGLWQRRFGGDRGVIGRTLTLNSEPYTVIGVMPESFHFAPFWAVNKELFAPLVLDRRLNDRGGRSLRIFARLRPGVALKQAQSEMDVICARLAALYPRTNTNLTAQVVPLTERVVSNIRPTLLVLLTTVGLVLLIACSNVANLLLVRANGKRRETAVRLALGCSRARLIRQSILESLLLATAGAVAAAALARWLLTALIASLPAQSLPRLQDVSVDLAVLSFTALLAIASGVLSGLAPAWRALHSDVQESLKSGGRGTTAGRSDRRVRSGLIVSEVALALLLLVGASLMLRTFAHLQAVDPGFDPRHVLTMEVAARGQSYPDAASRIRFFRTLRGKLEALPGVESISVINHLPIAGDLWTLTLQIAGRPAPPPGREFSAVYRVVQPGYFRTMRIPLTRGRDFNEHDQAPVAIVNEALARLHWREGNPLGQQIRVGDGGDWRTIVGVVRDSKESDWTAAAQPEAYLPHQQAGDFSYMTVVMRTVADPLALAKPAADAVHSLNQDVPVSGVSSMEQVIADKLWRGRLAMTLLGLFAIVAVALAGMGIYGVVSYSVSQRTGEIGVRMALGARRWDVLGLVLRQGVATGCAGIAIGLAGAWMLSRTLSGLLYGVTARDPVTFALVPVFLAAVVALASTLPAWRASKVDPLAALRHE